MLHAQDHPVKIKLPMVVFETTARCNLDCRYCYNIWKRPGAQTRPIDSYQQAVKTLRRLFKIADVRKVTMSGGEPFLSQRFSELVLFCRMKGKPVTVISNGTVASEEKLRVLIDIGVRLFEFPLHAAEAEIHDWITQKPGSWQRSLQAIKTVISLGVTVVPVIVLTKANCFGIEDTLMFLKDLGLRRIMLNRFNIGGRGIGESSRIAPAKNELQAAFAIADDVARREKLHISSNVCTPICVLDPARYPTLRFGHCTNELSRMPITLGVDGSVRLCNHSPVVVGNIFEHRFSEIFSSDYCSSWCSTVPQFCTGCSEFEKCLGGCRAASEQLGRTLNEVDPIVTF